MMAGTKVSKHTSSKSWQTIKLLHAPETVYLEEQVGPSICISEAVTAHRPAAQAIWMQHLGHC